MPVLRLVSSGPVVTALQEILTQNAHGRWETTPDAVTDTFEQSTSAAVQAFQRWNSIHIDGEVGDQTRASNISDGKVSLEDAVGLKHAADS
jgi:peptidoglycan hydrolase-like protein with peptidoglycan-binding domain